MSTRSCLVAAFSRYTELSDQEKDQLASLESKPVFAPQGSVLLNQGEKEKRLFVLTEGWVVNYSSIENGNRQILEVGLPGDIIGSREAALKRALSGVRALTPVRYCPVDKHHIKDLFGSSMKLQSIFYLINMRRVAQLSQRVISLGSRETHARIAHFILEIQSRLEEIDSTLHSHFDFPFTQEVLADALGVSTVHVSRITKRLKEEGLVTINRGHAEIHDQQALIEAAGYDTDYLDVDEYWLAAS